MTDEPLRDMLRERWVCDSCMRTVYREQIADFADGEHVLCYWCHDPDDPRTLRREIEALKAEIRDRESERADIRHRLDEAESRIAAVQRIHHRAEGGTYCSGCWEGGGEDGAVSWPCRTYAASEGTYHATPFAQQVEDKAITDGILRPDWRGYREH